jgi:acetamidase/formamidase
MLLARLEHLPCIRCERVRATVHWGYFDASLAPVLKVRSGDLVQAETVSPHAGDDPDLMFDPAIEALYRGIPEAERYPGPHIMTGPSWSRMRAPVTCSRCAT